MRFLYPLGLLGLIGVPILIIIYILKNKYTEQTVSSTYLWTLSEKFLKRKNPISKLTGIISLILQILAIVCISLAIAHPSLIISNAAHEYCFILDASGSMQMQKDGVTRFQRGKDEIQSIIHSSVEGSTYTLVYVDESTNVVYERVSDKEQALLLLGELEPSYDTAVFTDAIGVAQGYYDENKALKTYLVTDMKFEKVKNINVVNVSAGESNFAISEVSYTVSGGTLTVTGNLISYGKDADLTVQVYTDGVARSLGAQIQVKKDEATPFTVECESEPFAALKVAVVETDGLAQDNEYIIYDTTSESSYDTLIVSKTPFMLRTALQSLVNARIDVVDPDDYLETTTGYGLYIFDGCSLRTLPSDGAVWLFNPQTGTDQAGFNVQGTVDLEGSDKLEMTKSTATTVQKLTKDLVGSDIYLTKYVRLGTFSNFTNLYTYQSNPIIFTGTNTYGNREAVFAFSLHDSNLPVLYDFIPLLKNMISYSFPGIVDKTDYICGETADINVLANCESIRVESPSGGVSYLEVDSATAGLILEEVGTYTVTMTLGKQQRTVYIYSAMTQAERLPVVTQKEEIRLQGMPTNNGFDGTYDLMLIVFILLAVIFIADWGVYCYEKHQLR